MSSRPVARGFVDAPDQVDADVIFGQASLNLRDESLHIHCQGHVETQLVAALFLRLLQMQFSKVAQQHAKLGVAGTGPIGRDAGIPGFPALPAADTGAIQRGTDIGDGVVWGWQIKGFNGLLNEAKMTPGHIRKRHLAAAGKACKQRSGLRRLGLRAIGNQRAVKIGTQQQGLHGAAGPG
jgi:hypothetical protein